MLFGILQYAMSELKEDKVEDSGYLVKASACMHSGVTTAPRGGVMGDPARPNPGAATWKQDLHLP